MHGLVRSWPSLLQAPHCFGLVLQRHEPVPQQRIDEDAGDETQRGYVVVPLAYNKALTHELGALRLSLARDAATDGERGTG